MIKKLKPYAIVLAGGKGSRLPIAGSIPKQFAPKFNDVTFVQDIVGMITSGIITPSRVIIVVTNDEQYNYAVNQLMPYRVPSTNVVKFNPHLGYVAVMAAAADYVRQIDPDAVLFITPSDSHIEGQNALSEAIEVACTAAQTGRPILIGAKVADANIVAGCGNARYSEATSGKFHKIVDFVEKPGLKRAARILQEDDTVVNTGLYAVRADLFCEKYPMEVLDDKLVQYENDLKRGVKRGADLKLDPTDMVKKLGMELLIGGFEWKDCGTLDAYYQIQRKTTNHRNASVGDVYRFECLDSLFVSATRGLHLYASYITKHIAVLTYMRENGYLDVAVVNMKRSQEVGNITDFFENGTAMSYQLEAKNNIVVPGNMSKFTRAAFLGVQNIFVDVNRLFDGDINVKVSANGECIYEE